MSVLYCSMCVTFLRAVRKKPEKNNLRRKCLVWVHGLNGYNMVKWAWWQKRETAGHTLPEDRKQRSIPMFSCLPLSPFNSFLDLGPWDGAAHIQAGSSLLDESSLDSLSQTCLSCVS